MNFLRISRRFLQPICGGSQAMTKTLFTQETLDVLSYVQNRADALQNIEGPEGFKWELKCHLDNEPIKELPKLINATEILVHLMSPTKDDYVLLHQMLYELNKFSDHSDKAKYTVGNLIMKALYSLNAFDAMKKFINDPELSVYFKGFRCTLLYLDLAFKTKNYNEILEMDDKCRNSIWAKRTSYSKFIDALVFGACYKLNTVESYNHAYALWLRVCESGQFKKTALFMAALAYKQHQGFVALQIAPNFVGNSVIEHINLLTLIEMQYYDELILCLSSWSTDERFSKIKLSKDVFDKIHQIVEDMPSKSSREQVRSMMNGLESSNRITNETFDDHLDRNITARIGLRGKRQTNDEQKTY